MLKVMKEIVNAARKRSTIECNITLLDGARGYIHANTGLYSSCPLQLQSVDGCFLSILVFVFFFKIRCCIENHTIELVTAKIVLF